MNRDPTYYKELARDFLGQYKEAQREIERMQRLIERLSLRADRLNQPLNPDKVQVQKSNNGPEDVIVEIADLQKIYTHDCKLAEKKCLEIALGIGELENKLHQEILRNYWLFGLRLEEIAVSENYAYRTIKKYHYRALEELGIILDKKRAL